jgi:nucleotide-binding universal stress UspA family protein
MAAPRHVAVVVDGSPASEAPLRFAIGVAVKQNCPATGIFVRDTGWVDFIGHDWQSSRNARQGFLNHIFEEQEETARQARAQFLKEARGGALFDFRILNGEPASTLIALTQSGSFDLLVLSRRALQICGRPSLRQLPGKLLKSAEKPVLLFP